MSKKMSTPPETRENQTWKVATSKSAIVRSPWISGTKPVLRFETEGFAERFFCVPMTTDLLFAYGVSPAQIERKLLRQAPPVRVRITISQLVMGTPG